MVKFSISVPSFSHGHATQPAQIQANAGDRPDPRCRRHPAPGLALPRTERPAPVPRAGLTALFRQAGPDHHEFEPFCVLPESYEMHPDVFVLVPGARTRRLQPVPRDLARPRTLHASANSATANSAGPPVFSRVARPPPASCRPSSRNSTATNSRSSNTRNSALRAS